MRRQMEKQMENQTEQRSGRRAPVLSVQNLSVKFSMYAQGTKRRELEVISGLCADVYAGEILAVVGSSGSGKSILASAVMGILPSNATVSGEMVYCGESLTEKRQEKLRGKEISLVPQSVSYLDPLMKTGRQVQGINGTKEQQRSIFRRFKLGENVGKMYPHQLSGGMARRVLVSTAVINGSKLIIADEPTPGLSIDLAMETLSCFRELADSGAAVMLITHDIDLALKVADRIAVFYAGTTLEIAPVSDFSEEGRRLRHPYTRAFYDALPQTSFKGLPGVQPYAGSLPQGCVFAPRCRYRTDRCLEAMPEMRNLRGGMVRCFEAV